MFHVFLFGKVTVIEEVNVIEISGKINNKSVYS